MTTPVVIAEAAQGYEGSTEIARLLIQGAAAARADHIKFQVVYASDLAEPGYEHYELFKQLEMPTSDWRELVDRARGAGLGFIADVFGPRSAEIAASGIDGVKIHSTCFFDSDLVSDLIKSSPLVLLSIGGIHLAELNEFINQHGDALASTQAVLMYGFQAEPTPTEANNLLRIRELIETTGLTVGFMDHSEGGGPDTLTLSAMALALGATWFEKHVTLDRALQLEDYVSALNPGELGNYVSSLRRLAEALGNPALELTPQELTYRAKALKRVVAARDLPAGEPVGPPDVRLSRPAEPAGLFRPQDAIGRRPKRPIPSGKPVADEDLE